MNRRDLCVTVAGCLAATAGCLTDTGPTGSVEPTRGDATTGTGADPQTPTATDEPTETRTTETIPPYNRSLHDLRVENRRLTTVSVRVVIRRRDTGDERTLTLRLDPGDSRTYEELDALSEPVEVRVTVGDETATYTPMSDGVVVVTLTDDGVDFEEVVA